MHSKKECGVPVIEDIIHILFDKTLYSEEMATYLDPYLKSKKYWDSDITDYRNDK